MKTSRIHTAIFLISATGIAYQIALMRVFSIAQWHHFAYMIISIAMLGFGASGTFLALLRQRIKGHEARLLRASAAILTISLVGCYVASQKVPFETLQLATQPNQVWHLLALYLILALPFFLVSTCITLGFFLVPKQVGRLYFFNMVGSGIGAIAIVCLMFVLHPSSLPTFLAFPSAVACLFLVEWKSYSAELGPKFFLHHIFTYIFMAMLLLAGIFSMMWLSTIRISEYKGLSYTYQFPDAEIVAEGHSPLSVVTAVSSQQIRETPGQIANYPWDDLGPIPRQVGLYFDAGAVSPVNRFDGDLERFAYLDYVTGAAAYRLVEKPDVLIVGAGGGTDVLGALYHDAEHVTALEIDPTVFALMRRPPVDEFSGHLYDRQDVTTVLAEGRGYLASHNNQFDLVQIALLDSFNASSAGVHALNESYLYTVEAMELYLDRLTPEGLLCITRWLKTPPRDALKMFATAVEALESMGVQQPEHHIVFLRSWNTGTILVSRAPLGDSQIHAVRQFCTERGFDLCHYPDISPEETNQYTLLERPYYYEFAQSILSVERDTELEDSVFYLHPATDDRPYFFRFFKWSSLPHLIRGMGSQWVPFVEWGYVTLMATLVQGIVVSIVLILLPLIVLRRRTEAHGAKRWVLVYFAGLGCAYMFLEIAFIQRFMLFLAYPIYAVAVVLTSFLVFSGLGSLYANAHRENQGRLMTTAAIMIAVFSLFYVTVLPSIFGTCASLSDWEKIELSVLLLAPLAFCMGIPFPIGLQIVTDRYEALLPWAWGINGCASVVGATGATVIAVHLGFRMLVLFALVAYGIAVLSLRRHTARHVR